LSCVQDVDDACADAAEEVDDDAESGESDAYASHHEPDPDGAYDRMVERALFGDLAAA